MMELRSEFDIETNCIKTEGLDTLPLLRRVKAFVVISRDQKNKIIDRTVHKARFGFIA